jgi:peptidoglycan/LPS O-acetylase OafA/YrhL
VAFLVWVSVLIHQAHQDHLPKSAPADPTTPVTYSCVRALPAVVLLTSSSRAWPVRISGAVIAALAAPMIFELPFDLIVMAKSYPPIPPDPALYRVLVFAPLFLIEITTLAFLTLTPMVTLRKTTFVCFSLMLIVFAVWGLYGFAYPSTPLPFALNVVSKVLAFMTALTMFLPERASVGRTAIRTAAHV